ncbi:response regulator transcription factor [Actinoplanes sp. RD1]|uniref:response regulator transcription factor n=1 Tax=Actinoplanes sp. RD1 TaxID=3064538 RepID=UPI00274064DA|nr:response regulator transcription factor [Actinoplanes sp. RD1]
MRVLLVEDDASIAEPLVDGLARYGIVTEHVATGAAALAAPRTDMVLLAPGLPDIDGAEVCRRLRQAGSVPLIMLTAREDGGRDRAAGADDYLPKPFSVGELVARMRAVEGRSRPAGADPVRRHGPLSVDTRTREVRLHKIPIPLSPKEYDLLHLLTEQPGAVVPRRHIVDTIWGPSFTGPGKTLDFHVASLRRKLGDPAWIENRRGVGFRLVVQP